METVIVIVSIAMRKFSFQAGLNPFVFNAKIFYSSELCFRIDRVPVL